MTAQHLYYLFQCFFIYAFLGWCTEVAFAAFKERRFVNRGFLNGPICPVYGFANNVAYIVSDRKESISGPIWVCRPVTFSF